MKEFDRREDDLVEQDALPLRRSRRKVTEGEAKPKKKSRIPDPIRRFWRRYQLTKIVLIILGLLVLTVGGICFS